MGDFLSQWLARASVMIPVVIATAALAWWILAWLGLMKRDAPLDGGDMRTWPFYFAMGDAAVFAIVFSAVAAGMGDSAWAAGVAGGTAAVIAIACGRLAGGAGSTK